MSGPDDDRNWNAAEQGGAEPQRPRVPMSLRLFVIALRSAAKKGGAIHIDGCFFGQTAMTEIADALEASMAQANRQTVDPVVGNISSTDDATGHG